MLVVKGEIPFIVIISVSVAGLLLLVLNVVLVSCFIHKRRGKHGGRDHLRNGPPAEIKAPSSEGRWC